MKNKEFKYRALYYEYHIIDARIVNGYMQVRIKRRNGRTKWYWRYRLVYELYKGDIPKGYHIHHKNMDKLDDRPKNLVLMTRKEHIVTHGIIYNIKGEGGSKRMLGKKHSDKTKKKMSIAALGNQNSYGRIQNNEELRLRRRLFKKFGNGRALKHISIENVVKLVHGEGLSIRKAAKQLGCSAETVRNRLRWFKENKETENAFSVGDSPSAALTSNS